MLVKATIRRRDWEFDKPGSMREAIAKACAKHRLRSYEVVRRDGVILNREGELDSYFLILSGEPMPDLSGEHREEWLPR